MTARQNGHAILKRCSCGTSWQTLETLLLDSDISVIGLQPALVPGKTESVYLFNHAACGNTLAISEAEVRREQLRN